MFLIVSAMERLGSDLYVEVMTTHTTLNPSPAASPNLDPVKVMQAMTKRSFATLATTSPADRSQVAGVLYEMVGNDLYVNTLRTSRKARNIADNPHVAVSIPIRRIPVGPPSSVQFQGTAEILDLDDPEIKRLLDRGSLGSLTGHGELEMPNGCFVRITPGRRINTYGLGMSLYRLIKDPLNAAGVIEMPRDNGEGS